MHPGVPTTSTMAVLAIAGLLSGGCVLFQPYVRDLKLTSLEPADTISNKRSSVGARTLRLTFTTKQNLFDLGNLYADIGLCPTAEVARLTSRSVTFQGRELWMWRQDQPQPTNGLFEYQTLFTYDAGRLQQSDTGQLSDLCFKIFAPTYFGAGGLDSRPGLIPSAAIEAALGVPNP